MEAARKVVSGGLWLTVSSLIMSLAGFAYWVIIGSLITGTELGYVTTAFSVAGLAAALASLGLGFAALRLIPEERSRVLAALLMLGCALGFIAGIAVFIFSQEIYSGFLVYAIIASFIAAVSVVGGVLRMSLVAAYRAERATIADAVGQVVKLAVGVALVLAGLGGVGALLGLFGAVAVTVLVLLAFALAYIGFSVPALEDFIELLKVGLSNYPHVLGAGAAIWASTALLAVLTRNPVSVGGFYMALMITCIIAALPSNMAFASIPVMVEEGDHNLAVDAVRIGLLFVAPLAAVCAVAPGFILSLINKSLAGSASAFTVLALGVPVLVYVNAYISRRNAESMLRVLGFSGAARIALITLLIVLLAPVIGGLGAAIAFVVGNAAALCLLLPHKRALKSLLACEASLVLSFAAASLIPVGVAVKALVAAATCFALLIALRVASINEACRAVKLALDVIHLRLP